MKITASTAMSNSADAIGLNLSNPVWRSRHVQECLPRATVASMTLSSV
jgi:hypothetical protein